MKFVPPKAIAAADLISSTLVEDEYAAWSSSTAYVAENRCIVVATHTIYEALQPSTNKSPPDNIGTYWAVVSATNQWTMFDGKVGTQSVASETLTVVLRCGAIDTLALINTECSTAEVIIREVGGAEVYRQQHMMNSESLIVDWWSYFFAPRGEETTELVLTGLPLYPQATVEITLERPNGTVACGMLLYGVGQTIGTLLWNPQASMLDYSIKEVDEFGNPTLVPRNYAKLLSCDVRVPTSNAAKIQRTLAAYRASAVLWIGCELYASTIVFGFMRSFSEVLASTTQTDLTLEIEGLI